MKSFIDVIIAKLKVNDKIYLFDKGEVKQYKFLTIHPNNNKYIIVLDMCEEPVRLYKFRLCT